MCSSGGSLGNTVAPWLEVNCLQRYLTQDETGIAHNNNSMYLHPRFQDLRQLHSPLSRMAGDSMTSMDLSTDTN